MLSHRNVVNNAHSLAQGLGLSPADRLCTTFPFFHIAGCAMSVLGCLSHGACLVGVDRPGALPILQALQAMRCTALFGVATMYTDLLSHPGLADFDLSSLRTGTMGGAICPEPLLHELITRLGLSEMTVSYGLTETSPIVTLTGRHDPLEWRTQTVGQRLPEVELKIVDPATRQPLPIGAEGELATRGPFVMMGYYDDPAATARAMDQDGWFYSGDQATLDQHGNVRITGRLKDLIIRGGENISPASVEDVLRQHPAVLDACVFGLPDARLGERVAAALRLRPGHPAPELEEIRAFCRNKLASFKLPQQLSVVESFPLTASGKVKRYALQSQASCAAAAKVSHSNTEGSSLDSRKG
jgi:acyl-CoA synthetase (AMP-forming)/AMP-acid ligase II